MDFSRFFTFGLIRLCFGRIFSVSELAIPNSESAAGLISLEKTSATFVSLANKFYEQYFANSYSMRYCILVINS